ncbi:hypothetical protein PX860_01035 [Agrobacterium leguminum]|uniref:hypothetical protein n=1 Tax=Agrobacterium leguminum TaxID=2792015 RepID=UPI0027296CBC|nr:hypothetical protein [Agrobacterium leguminum]WLD97109.1 hypothetical protein PX860_01035 [Agrobacterium leguminum]
MARRKRRKTNGSIGAIVLGTLLLLLTAAIAGGFGFLYFKASNQVALNETTLCPITSPTSITAVLIDVSDPISPVTEKDLRNRFGELKDSIPVGGQIVIYELTDEAGKLNQVFMRCNPGSGDEADELISNPRFVQKRWEDGFDAPLKKISEGIGTGNSSDQSPILGGIQTINLEAFGNHDYAKLPKRLIVASDMIEHTSNFSMYRTGIAYDKFEATSAPQTFRTPLDNVAVEVWEFVRPGVSFSATDLSEFWAKWLKANGASSTRFIQLQGVEQ